VREAVGVAVGVRVNVGVGVFVGMRVIVGVEVLVGVRVMVGVGVFEGVNVIVGVKVFVGVVDGVTVTFPDGVGVASPWKTKRTASAPTKRSAIVAASS